MTDIKKPFPKLNIDPKKFGSPEFKRLIGLPIIEPPVNPKPRTTGEN